MLTVVLGPPIFTFEQMMVPKARIGAAEQCDELAPL
jgi:hypothetical protein